MCWVESGAVSQWRGSDAELEAPAEDQSGSRDAKGRIYSDAGWREHEQSIARSNWVCTLLVCVRRVIY